MSGGSRWLPVATSGDRLGCTPGQGQAPPGTAGTRKAGASDVEVARRLPASRMSAAPGGRRPGGAGVQGRGRREVQAQPGAAGARRCASLRKNSAKPSSTPTRAPRRVLQPGPVQRRQPREVPAAAVARPLRLGADPGPGQVESRRRSHGVPSFSWQTGAYRSEAVNRSHAPALKASVPPSRLVVSRTRTAGSELPPPRSPRHPSRSS